MRLTKDDLEKLQYIREHIFNKDVTSGNFSDPFIVRICINTLYDKLRKENNCN
jgi:hypothetical protein